MTSKQNSPVTLYNFTAENVSEAGEILLLQLEEDGLAEEYFSDYGDSQYWRWTPAAYAINAGDESRSPLARLAHQIYRTSPVGWVGAWEDGRLDEI